MKTQTLKLALAIAGTLLISGTALAADYEVEMLNRGNDGQPMAFEPAYLEIEPGDSVTFVLTEGTHNAEIIPGMLPEGAEAWKGAMNEEFTVTFDQEGLYGYKCLPHYGMGMVGVIKVGDEMSNADAAEEVKHPGRAGQKMAELFEQLKTSQTAQAQ
ncbi:pseudoazurin [Fodinicurvata fenggangensis]|uniref:pseudoazurin n=1 Tax=Fodinicurvata fenggangensis TaxID=1121830 RepID=UPI0004793B83|nr:pseudoazurin [Fodinicurvata fenggangensis]